MFLGDLTQGLKHVSMERECLPLIGLLIIETEGLLSQRNLVPRNAQGLRDSGALAEHPQEQQPAYLDI
jgi:hypothetical protein